MNYLRRDKGLRKAERVLRIFRQTSVCSDGFYDPESRYAHLLLRTRVLCSCVMCGNPRRHFGTKTIQEIESELHLSFPMPVDEVLEIVS